MCKFLVLTAFFFGSLVFLPSCEKETKEITQITMTYNVQAFLDALDDLEDNQVLILAMLNDAQDDAADLESAIAALAQTVGSNHTQLMILLNLIKSDTELIKSVVQGLAISAANNTADLQALLLAIQGIQGDLTLLLNLTDDIVDHLLDVKADIQAISGDISAIQAQLALVYANTITMLVNQGNLQNGINQANNTLATLVSAVGSLENMLNLVLQQQGNQGAAIATLVANSNNHTQMLQNALNGINALTVDNAMQTGMIQTILSTLASLGQDVNALSATVVNGLSALQLGVANQNAILGQLLANSSNQTATLNVILAKLDVLAQSQADQGALLATLIANSANQLAVSQQILDHVQNGNLTNSQILALVQAIPTQLNALGSSLNAWGSTIVNGIDGLGLTLAQQGTVIGQIWAGTQGNQALALQIINKLDALQLSINDLQTFIASEIASVKAQISQVQVSLAALQATVDGISLQILTLSNNQAQGFATVIAMLNDLNDNLCCPSCNSGNPPSITSSVTNVFNSYVDNSVNQNLSIQQIYNLCNNAVGVCPTSPSSPTTVPGIQVCPVINVAMPIIQGNQNNTQFNFGQVGNQASTVQQNWGC